MPPPGTPGTTHQTVYLYTGVNDTAHPFANDIVAEIFVNGGPSSPASTFAKAWNILVVT